MLAVVVAHNPGEWFVETLESLAHQDYSALRIAVIDASGNTAAASRAQDSGPDKFAESVDASIEGAAIVRAGDASGFSEAANAILRTGPDTDFLLLCHDDVAFAPEAVSALVAEAQRSNAGVAGPKIVDWNDPTLILQAGYDVDRFGLAVDRAGAGELEQEQHDGACEVFAVPSAAMLVRTDLFTRLGGFDAAMTFCGEDVDLCWRAHLAGAKVMMVGAATIRHRGRLAQRRGVDEEGRLSARHTLRAMMVNHGIISLALLLPVAALMSFVEAVAAVCLVRFGRARDVLAAWTWNISRLDVVTQRRRANSQVRKVRPADVTVKQYFGSAAVTSLIRRQFGAARAERRGGSAAWRAFGDVRSGTVRMAWIAWACVLVYTVFGSRDLIASGVPAVGDFAPFPEEHSELLRHWWRGWSNRDLGAPSANLGGLALLGLLGAVPGVSMGAIRTLWVLGPILIGLIGAYRLLAATGSRRAQIAALAGYLLVPLGSASVSAGSTSGLIAYAAAPWILGAMLRALARVPFRDIDSSASAMPAAAVSLGAVTAMAAMFEPATAGLLLPIAAGLALGGLISGRLGGLTRLFAVTVMSVPVIALVCIAFVVDLIAAGASWDVFSDGRDGTAGPITFTELLRFDVGPHDPGAAVWLFALPMLVPLLLGRGWRLEQSVRFWMVAIAAWGLALAAQTGALAVGLPDPQLLLAPAAAAVAALCGMAVLSIEHDLRFSHFGWRQALMPLTAAAAILLVLGSIGQLETGRWNLASSGHGPSLRFEPQVLSGRYRVLWIGAPQFLSAQGRSLGGGVAWVATEGESTTILDRAVPADAGDAQLVEQAIDHIVGGDTARGGRMLAGVGIRYVVLLNRLAPAAPASGNPSQPFLESLTAGFSRQLDLELVEATNSAVEVFDNTSWVPMYALHSPGFDSDIADITDLESSPLSSGAPVFSSDGPPWTSPVLEQAEVLVMHTPRPGWRVSVDGEAVPRRAALSWARAYVPLGAGDATLSYEPPPWRRAAQLLGSAAPFVLLVAWMRRRMSRS